MITKAVIPAAGLGTRFLPATKAMPKEMLPIVDKPIIQYVIEELVEAGIQTIVIVTGWHKRAIEDHFDYPFELEYRLARSEKYEILEEIRRISQMANFIYVRQKGPAGNATPILNAQPVIGHEPFLVLWGDDFIMAEPSRTKQLIEAFTEYQCSILGAIRTKKTEDTYRYGYAAGEEIKPGVVRVNDLIEKPGPEKVPSDLAIVSGFIFTPEIFDFIKNIKPGPTKEVVYVDALKELMKIQPIYACEIKNSRYYDTGNKLEYIKTNIEFALKREEFGQELKTYLKNLDLDKF